MKLHFVWIGKTKDANCAALIREYLKRLGRYTSHEVTELKDAGGSVDEGRVKAAEAARLLASTSDDDFVVLLDEKGTELTSAEWAEFIRSKQDGGTRRLAFVIGGFAGVDETIKQRSDLQVGLAKMTMTHELARVLLMEQVYRAYSILAGSPYHKI